MDDLLTFNRPNLTKDNILWFFQNNYQLSGATQDCKIYTLQEKNPSAFAGTSQAFVMEVGESSYMLKENLFALLDKEYESMLLIPKMLEHLHSQGIKVLPVHQTALGADYSNARDHRVEVIDFLDEVRTANIISKREKDIKETARELARFHHAIKTLDGEIINKFKDKPDLYLNGRVNKKTGQTFLQELDSHEQFYSRSTEGYDQETIKHFAILREDFEKVQGTTLTGFQEGICHRDVHTYNVLIDVKTGEFRAFVDWDIAKYSPFVHDLGYAVDSFSADRTDKYKKPDLKLAELFLNEYLKCHPLPNEDLSRLFDPLRDDMVDRTAIFMRADYGGNKDRSNCVASHVSLHWRIRQLESLLR